MLHLGTTNDGEKPVWRRLAHRGGGMQGLRTLLRSRGAARFLRDASIVAYLACLVWAIALAPPDTTNPTTIGTDTSNYYAAGQRLNDGHLLYALSPGDRPVPTDPPYYTAPLLSPPLIAVLWRPLALLPAAPIMYLWWLGGAGIVTAMTLTMAWRGSAKRNLVILLLSPWLALTAWTGNLNCYLIVVLAASFWASQRGHGRSAGAMIAFAALVKVTPLLYLPWLVVRRDRAGLIGFAVAAAILGLISLLGAGLQAHFAYLDVARATGTAGITDLSIPGILINAGLAPTLAQLSIPIIGIWAVAATWQLRRRSGAAFFAATLGAVFTQPSLGLHSLSLLLPGVAPYDARPAAERPGPSRVG